MDRLAVRERDDRQRDRDHADWRHQPERCDAADHLFERFYRRAARETTSGTGMGLAITRGLLVAAGGRVWAENVRTGGARFSVVVPAAVRTMPITEVT